MPLSSDSELAEALERALTDGAWSATSFDAELARLVALARSLEASVSDVAPTPQFRTAARRRLLQRIARPPRVASPRRMSVGEQARRLVFRLAVAMTAMGLAGGMAASASATALPGDLLYPMKQASENLALEFARDDSARQQILMQQADTRVDEAARLLDEGRADDAAATAERYADTITSLPVSPELDSAQASLRANEVRLHDLLQAAPPPARVGLQRALQATEQHLSRGRPITSATTGVHDVGPAVMPTTELRQSGPPSDADLGRDATPARVEAAPAKTETELPARGGPAADKEDPSAGEQHRNQPPNKRPAGPGRKGHLQTG